MRAEEYLELFNRGKKWVDDELPFLKQDSKLEMNVSGNERTFTCNGGTIHFDEEITVVEKGDILSISKL